MMTTDDMDIKFGIRKIIWSDYAHTTPVLLQEENGPCPLIALVNTLVLKNDIETRTNQLNDIENSELQIEVEKFKNQLLEQKLISLKDLLSQVGDLLIKFNGDNKDIDKFLESLPLLHTGLNINPNLVDGGFETDLATELFTLFNLKINHGWIYEPQDAELNSTMTKLQNFDSVQDYLLTTDDEKLKQWLDENSTQLTQHGLSKLNKLIDIDEFIVFFRNNHFSTLFKKGDNDFYLLLTDSSFDKKEIVWQSIISISGKDDLFFNGEFTPILEEGRDVAGDDDLRLIKQLQEQEDAEYAKNLQKSYQKRKPPVKEPIKETSDKKKKERKKKGNCIIV
ncbi:ubiquitin carboxyl-terminal hydrolase MIY1 [[Candida] jaroonii]|uniref:Ubiquitin carboxyl-terminal hydrolase MIY1 n=1 Tax=[Candida] jaroonii TaxID=467808 RepID=A0ACA9YG69_9ASCO|nr:ubiquitin carboxyl-terminal hydrolase MIY1 [[Candida] jaroonii]